MKSCYIELSHRSSFFKIVSEWFVYNPYESTPNVLEVEFSLFHENTKMYAGVFVVFSEEQNRNYSFVAVGFG